MHVPAQLIAVPATGQHLTTCATPLILVHLMLDSQSAAFSAVSGSVQRGVILASPTQAPRAATRHHVPTRSASATHTNSLPHGVEHAACSGGLLFPPHARTQQHQTTAYTAALPAGSRDKPKPTLTERAAGMATHNPRTASVHVNSDRPCMQLHSVDAPRTTGEQLSKTSTLNIAVEYIQRVATCPHNIKCISASQCCANECWEARGSTHDAYPTHTGHEASSRARCPCHYRKQNSYETQAVQ
ncbi:hypothetical protein COO60DRAFT_555816 [Scenedesmus sp. NREL 46B-D3]|nr:hypothetical protein COO60DRAFT_555816 [Scenedesmus sp. NREL 46B-D3]